MNTKVTTIMKNTLTDMTIMMNTKDMMITVTITVSTIYIFG
jgi:hypothetical protein